MNTQPSRVVLVGIDLAAGPVRTEIAALNDDYLADVEAGVAEGWIHTPTR
ncbi:hypothetical protein [Corynebacterium cystitidis]|uniref:Uncharacterized protein n=1 Tax=Corynebacterium cystitidis DSM 20524 TaxID=1121357 RepID=A0A1H9RT31_9CORY|nr:hypothetical protein [Corynebacterium cystitidis]WJY82070.1 hypothetical protein CCYS_05670 [Corynebacterium cystitidis DSM 20524]SER75952.1 hypothetical protein SAMN05661109_00908 [Corynebacterium cystitidis DSM 20524]SNV79863.1 Uncharacterised protein [Corynebacterium cystitidis]